jgi:hypothetical protein
LPSFTNVTVKIESQPFRYADIDEYLQQARGTGFRQKMEQMSSTDAEKIRRTLARRVGSGGGATEFYSTATALIGVGKR